MPPILIAFFILSGLAHTDTLVRGPSSVLRGRDPSVSFKTTIQPLEYSVTTAPWRGRLEDKKGGCDFQLLARVLGGGPVRARIDSWEQLLDTSWTPRYRLPGGQVATIRVEFVDPRTGYTLADRTGTFHCWSEAPGGVLRPATAEDW